MSRVTVILTSYNHARYIQEAIDSVLHQTYTDFELIVLDDASTDESWSIIGQYTDARLRSFRSEERHGGVMEINRTILERATGDYIAIHHSDDIWEPTKLEKQVALLDRHQGLGAVFTNAAIIKEDGSSFTETNHFYSRVFDQPNRTRHEWLRFFFKTGNALCHPSILIRRSCYSTVGLYKNGLFQLCDFEMWVRLCLHYEIHVLQEPLIKFRIRDHEANASGNRPDSRIRGAYEMYKAYQNFGQISRIEDIERVFPAARIYNRGDETDTGFALAMMALDESSLPMAHVFAQDMLFDALADPKRAANIKAHYAFDEISFYELLGHNDIFAVEIVAQLRQEIAIYEAQTAELHDKLGTLNRIVVERDQEIALNDLQTAELHNKLGDLARIVAERGQQIETLTQAIAERNDTLEALSKSLAKQEQEIAARDVAFQKLEAELRQLRNSRSWRITAPLRAVISLLRRFTGSAMF
jgi:glycosyltransferase involved in cell wall biosynthesis/uncharacterized coiled-coil protein SlyX